MISAFLIALISLMLLSPLLFPAVIIIISQIMNRNTLDKGMAISRMPETWPMVSILIAIHNKSGVIEKKLNDIASCDYPKNLIEIILVLDGKVKGIEYALSQFKEMSPDSPELKVIQCERSGKNTVLNKAAENASGSILIFTDADARLDSSTIRNLVAIFSDSDVGGGCGLHVLSSKKGAQKKYWNIESAIKAAEQKLLKSITASYGTISAIQKEIFTPIPNHVADDLYLALLVTSKGKRFSFCPQSLVYIEKPSQNLFDEIKRRRRIVSQSLGTLSHFKNLMNPVKHGSYAICLVCHKLLRRLVPLNAILLLVLCILKAFWGSLLFTILSLIQMSIYTILGSQSPRFLKA